MKTLEVRGVKDQGRTADLNIWASTSRLQAHEAIDSMAPGEENPVIRERKCSLAKVPPDESIIVSSAIARYIRLRAPLGGAYYRSMAIGGGLPHIIMLFHGIAGTGAASNEIDGFKFCG